MTDNKRGTFVGHPGMLAAYFIAALAALLLLIYKTWQGCLACSGGLAPEQGKVLRLVIYTFCFGGIGGTTYSIYGLYKHTAKGDFDANYVYWYLFRTPLGAILGMMVYFLIQGGLFAFTQDPSKDNFQTRALIVGTAFLAGFSTNQFIDKLKEISKTLWGVGSHKGKTN